MDFRTFQEKEGLQISEITEYHYELGKLSFSVPLVLTDAQLEVIREVVKANFGENGEAEYLPKKAVFKLSIVDRVKKEETLKKQEDARKAFIHE